MKKLILLIFLLTTVSCFAQSKSDYTGTWEIIVKRSEGKDYKTPIEFVVLSDDGSYIWGIDSANADPMQSVIKGTWDVTNEGIKLVPNDNPDNEITYYRKSGDDMLKWVGHEIKGRKYSVMLEMSMYLERRK